MKIHGRGGKTGKNTKEVRHLFEKEEAKKEKIERSKKAKARKVERKFEEALEETKKNIFPKTITAMERVLQWEKARSKPKKLINIYKLAIDRWQHERILELLREELKNVVPEETYANNPYGCFKKNERERITRELIGANPTQKQIEKLNSQIEKYKKHVENLTKR